MNKRYHKYITMLITLLAAYAESHAAEVTPGDYEQVPGGTNLGLLYYQYSTTDSAYSQGSKIANNFKVDSNVGILRFVHSFQLNERTTIDPQFLLPFGKAAGSDNASALGDTSGIGDITFTAPIRYRLNDAKDIIAGTLYISAPTGDYDQNKSLNLGGNRWKWDFQGAYVKHFNPYWALDVIGDVILYSKNDDYGSTSADLEQNVSYESQIMGRYMPNPTTSFALGLGHNWGGETKINGAKQDDQISTTNIRFTASKFFTAKDQFQIQLGRDLSVDNGVKEDFRMNLRYLRIF